MSCDNPPSVRDRSVLSVIINEHAQLSVQPGTLLDCCPTALKHLSGRIWSEIDQYIQLVSRLFVIVEYYRT